MASVDRLEVLFKKYSGVVDANPGLSVAAEPGVNAKPYVIANRIISQPIPAVAPTDLITDSSSNTFNSLGNGTRQVSTAYPYLLKYTNLKLIAAVEIGDPLRPNQ
jgi:hypothetical protein